MKQKNGFIPGGTCWWGSEGGQHQQEEIHKQKSPRVKRKAVSASTPDLAIVGAFTIDLQHKHCKAPCRLTIFSSSWIGPCVCIG
jgi:hypothetical protein